MAKLGTHGRPAVLRVQTLEKAEEIMSLCDTNGWKAIVGVEPQEPEDLTDLYRLQGARPDQSGGQQAASARRISTVGRNDACPCGSGRKYKRCCASRIEVGEEQVDQA